MAQQTLDEFKSTSIEEQIGNFTPDERAEEEPMDVPTMPPPHRQVSEEALAEAVSDLLDDIEFQPRPLVQEIDELPRWLDQSDIPTEDRAGPDRCGQCGMLGPTDEPLEKGRELALSGDDGNPCYDPCPPGKYNIDTCSCCGCPGCYCKSIYARQNKTPTYRCRNPDCKLEFEYPIELPLDPDEVRRHLYYSCRWCGEPTLAPFEGIPELTTEPSGV